MNFTGIEIRRAEARDAPAIASLLADSFVEYEPLYTPEGYAATAITSERVEDRITEGPVWVALSDEMIVGTVSVVAKGGSLYVRGMAVWPTSRGLGIGELLLAKVEEFAEAARLQAAVFEHDSFFGSSHSALRTLRFSPNR